MPFTHTYARNNANEIHCISLIITGPPSCDRFIDLLNRALNCFPDAHSELKEFADNLVHDRVLQDYKHQTTNKQELKDNAVAAAQLDTEKKD